MQSRIAIFLLLVVICATQCPSPTYQRCLCTSTPPYCPCSAITSTVSLNFTTSYASHLVLVPGAGCRPCSSSCNVCTSLKVCTSCAGSFYLANINSTSTCIPCPINCLLCPNGVCTTCINTYYLDYQTNCQPCPLPGTLTCTITSLISCLAGYSLDNNAANCLPCSSNCIQCTSPTRCSSCSIGYYLNSTTYSCSACMSMCYNCTNSTACLSCNGVGVVWNGSGCVVGGILGCMIYASANACSQCNSTYYLTSGKSCAASSIVIANCLYYSQGSGSGSGSNPVCSVCQPSFYNYPGTTTCMPYCSVLCSACFGPHYGLCYSCNQNAVLYNLQCLPTYNLNSGSSYQLYYTGINDNVWSGGSVVMADSCSLEGVYAGQISTSSSSSLSSISISLSSLQSYQITVTWKVYIYRYSNTTGITPSYTISFNNSAYTSIQSISVSECVTQCAVSPTCVSISNATYSNLVASNTLTFSTTTGTIGISEVLIVASRCGGVQGAQCLTCSSISVCTSCVNPRYYILGETCVVGCPANYYTHPTRMKCYPSCPPTTYSVDSTQQCFDCQSPCATCSSATVCLTCINSTYYNPVTATCVSTCPVTYYPTPIINTCDKCIYPCLSCLNTLQCLSCSYGFYDNSTHSCLMQCASTYFGNLSSMACSKCVSPCNTCYQTGTQCLTCLPSYYYFNQKCLSQCPAGYYSGTNSSSSSCSLCDSSCLSCSIISTNCTSCGVGTYLLNSACVTSCGVGYYSDQIQLVCQLCPVQCFSCTSARVCTNCTSSYVLYPKNYTCLNNCPAFTYVSVSGTGSTMIRQCLSCQLPCRECLSSSVCSSCASLFLYNGTCISQCPPGSYPSPSAMACLPCNLSLCVECISAPVYCTKCSSSLLLINNTCLSNCSVGFYYLEVESVCIPCDQRCQSCANASYCFICAVGYILQGGACVNTCPNSYYIMSSTLVNNNTITLICLPCMDGCINCLYNSSINQVVCSQCNNTRFLSNNQCSPACPNVTFGLNSVCYACLAPCLTCISEYSCSSCSFGGLLNGSCLSDCPYGYYLMITNNNVCSKCDAICGGCIGISNNCTECPNGKYLTKYLTQTSTYQFTCSSSCMDGYFASSSLSQCIPCSSLCLTCNITISNCISCASPLILYGSTCISQCPQGQYKDTSNTNYNPQCIPCKSNCQICRADRCLLCASGTFMEGNICVSNCSLGRYGNSGMCLACTYPCKTCTNDIACLTCVTGYLYYSPTASCLANCLTHTYSSSNQTCLDCPSSCYSCLSYNLCLQCSTGYLVNGSCQSTCPPSTYPYYSTCLPCMYGCSNCSDSYHCNYCTQGYLYAGSCVEYCPLGFVAQISNSSSSINSSTNSSTNTLKLCQQCISTCIKCTITPSTCLSCIQGLYLYLFSCVESCPIGSYQSSMLSSCLPCKSPCFSCNNSYSCLSCIYGYILYRQSSGNQCIVGPYCPNSFYLNMESNTCDPQCNDTLLTQITHRTCSSKCPLQFVQDGLFCVVACSDGFWINEELICTNQTRPPVLPSFSCSGQIVRNLLIIKCIFTMQMSNLADLTVDNFSLTYSNIQEISVIDSKTVVLVTSQQSVINQQWLNLSLTFRYGLFSVPTLTSRLLQSSPHAFPLQSFYSVFFIPFFTPYSLSQRQLGLKLLQFAASISLGALIMWIFAVIKNLRGSALMFVGYLQWIWLLGLVDGEMPPNWARFTQGCRLSALISTSGGSNKPWWTLSQFYTINLWGTINLFSFTSTLLLSVILLSFFIMIYGCTRFFSNCFSNKVTQQKSTLKQLNLLKEDTDYIKQPVQAVKDQQNIQSSLKSSIVPPQEGTMHKFALKCSLIANRFHYNYFFHAMLITSIPISIGAWLGIVQSGIIFIGGVIGIILQVLTIIICLKNYFTCKKKVHQSSRYFFISFTQSIVLTFLLVFTPQYFFLSLALFISIVNIYQFYQFSHYRLSLFLLQSIKIILLSLVIIAEMQTGTWNSDQMFILGWILVGVAIVGIGIVAGRAAKQFFEEEENKATRKKLSTKKQAMNSDQNERQKEKKRSRALKKSLLSKSSTKSILLPSKGNISDWEPHQTQSFFTNKQIVLDDSEEDSDLDIIDFDGPGQERAPNNLMKIAKNKEEAII